MKKKEGLIAVGAIAFSVLFYKQMAGVNYLIFSLIYALLTQLIHEEKRSKHWYFALILHVVSAINVYVVHSDVALWAWSFSLLVVVGNTRMIPSSFFVSVFSGVASLFVSIEKIHAHFFNPDSEKPVQRKWGYLVAVLISFVLISIFFFIYKGANPLFHEFTKKIDFSWLDFPFLLFCLVGFWVLYSMLYPFYDAYIQKWDEQKLKQLVTDNQKERSVDFRAMISLVAILVFVALNGMLLILNYLDIRSIFILEKLPENIFLSDFLHFAVWSTVFSILLAIILILGIQQFNIKSKWINVLVFSWMAQSLVMVFNTVVRNYWYSFNQITYLRIGVFVFLAMCIFGLIYTFFSLLKNRNAWFLIDLNFKTWFVVLVISSCFSWDRMITKHNLTYSKKSEIDLDYLNGLSDNNLDLLLNFYEKNPTLFAENNERYFRLSQGEKLLKRKLQAIKRIKKINWQSDNLPDRRLKNYLKSSFIKDERTRSR